MIAPAKKINQKKAVQNYKDLLLPRLIEERMLTLLRQNKISKWFSGMGQEAISVGSTLSLKQEDYILPMHRNLGVFTTRKVPLYSLFTQLFGKRDGFTGGRDRSFHFGTTEHRIFGMISHLAATMPVADGIALAAKLREKDQVALSFCGDGATSEGDFHEALNLAAVWKLPVIFMIENNGYGLSTPSSEQFACENIADRAVGYGMESMIIDGNDFFEVQEAVTKARKLALSGKPVLIEAKTFRMRGHEEASGTFYVPDELFEQWSEKDPIKRYEEWLLNEEILSESEMESIRVEIKSQFNDDLERALDAEEPSFDEKEELNRAGFKSQPKASSNGKKHDSSEKRIIDAVHLAQKQAFTEDDTFVMLGQDIAEYGGVFKASEGFVDLFGKDRIRNTPIIESGAIGAAIGLAIEGFKPVVEMQFADFISCGYNQIVNNLSKGRYRWMPDMNITIRAPHGGGVGAGPFHSQCPENWFMQLPGLRVLVPSNVQDAQNMLYTALYDENPVLFFEHKKLYRSIKEITPDHCEFTDLEKASVIRDGKNATIVTFGYGVVWAKEIAEDYEKQGVSIEIIDLRSLAPIDWDTVVESIRKTGRVLLLQENSEILGPMSELSAGITERAFKLLDAPIIRCSSLHTPVPFNKELEKGYMANHRLKEQLEKLLNF
ncbi:alpha-ketoacid dehydrogenase subunit alpha/beta [Rhodohalobacter barkolensis]|uniref:Dehydrogenase n=1 Tax=Rhodohalobacter barkolensis TaxID=2053187 RepID=A0A2N0VKU9_9BACT|nr:alpha-ketoacid dehydrogenase subunit alpha/beta [Rhodohalobacter barkolensis]PKD44825.1 dehydrogenase [Rhodohalobacter barkolensis]